MFTVPQNAQARKTSSWLNRVRHQPGATSARTLQHNSEVEGQRILKHLQHKSKEILQAHQFSAKGLPLTPASQDKEPQGSPLKEETVEKALHSSQIPAALRPKMSANPVPYENPCASINISVDDVGVKVQKQQRLLQQRQKQSRPRNNANIPIKLLFISRISSAAMFLILLVSSPPGRF